MPKSESAPDGAVVPRALRDAELYRAMVDQLEEGIYMVDCERRIHYWNQGAEHITGYRAHEVVGRLCQTDLLMHRDAEGTLLCGDACPLLRVIEDGKPHECLVFLRHRQGHCVPVRVRALPIHDSSGGITGAVEVFEEASPHSSEICSADTSGCVDPATGAACRPYGEQKAAHSLADFENFDVSLGWLRLELDDAERLEHRYGQGVIDAALKLISNSVARNLGPRDLLTRWSHTEFRVAIHHCTHRELVELARKLVVLARCSSLEWWGDPLRLTVSIGGGMAEPGDSLISLEERSAETCAASRSGGGNRATLDRRAADDGEETLHLLS